MNLPVKKVDSHLHNIAEAFFEQKKKILQFNLKDHTE